jgi:hypothetical protein
MDTARSTLRHIYDLDERPDLTDKILQQLDLHPLLVTLLPTVAHENDWDNCRLSREWEKRQTGVLRTEHNDSLAAAIELSLTSPMFEALGSDARDATQYIKFASFAPLFVRSMSSFISLFLSSQYRFPIRILSHPNHIFPQFTMIFGQLTQSLFPLRFCTEV